MLSKYLPILIFLVVAAVLAVRAARARHRHRPLLRALPDDRDKLSPYECGFEAFEDSRMRFDVRYYLVAILFIVFDLEIAFLFPWAVSLREIGTFGLLAMVHLSR